MSCVIRIFSNKRLKCKLDDIYEYSDPPAAPGTLSITPPFDKYLSPFFIFPSLGVTFPVFPSSGAAGARLDDGQEFPDKPALQALLEIGALFPIWPILAPVLVTGAAGARLDDAPEFPDKLALQSV